jgi:hypothetical protein
MIDTEGNATELDLDAKEGSLQTLQTAVDGLIEAVDINKNLTLWLNEEGKLLGLPMNSVGTAMYRRATEITDTIVGNIVLTGGVDDEGDTIGLTEEQVSTWKFIATN